MLEDIKQNIPDFYVDTFVLFGKKEGRIPPRGSYNLKNFNKFDAGVSGSYRAGDRLLSLRGKGLGQCALTSDTLP